MSHPAAAGSGQCLAGVLPAVLRRLMAHGLPPLAHGSLPGTRWPGIADGKTVNRPISKTGRRILETQLAVLWYWRQGRQYAADIQGFLER
jgi:hypothetical protein